MFRSSGVSQNSSSVVSRGAEAWIPTGSPSFRTARVVKYLELLDVKNLLKAFQDGMGEPLGRWADNKAVLSGLAP